MAVLVAIDGAPRSAAALTRGTAHVKNHVYRHGHGRVISSAIDWTQCHTERTSSAIPARRSRNRTLVVPISSGCGTYLPRTAGVDTFTPPGTPGAKKPAPEARRPSERERR